MDDLEYLKAVLSYDDKKAASKALSAAVTALKEAVPLKCLSDYKDGLDVIIEDLKFFQESTELIPSELDRDLFVTYSYYYVLKTPTRGGLRFSHLAQFVHFCFKSTAIKLNIDIHSNSTLGALLPTLRKFLARQTGLTHFDELFTSADIYEAVDNFREKHKC